MPLTPAHAAAALPISRALPALPLAALVIGTLSPDFEYLLRLAPHGQFGHSPAGLFVFCVPVSLLAWVVFAAIVRPALAGLLPPEPAAALTTRRPTSPRWRRRSLALGALAAFLGAVSHVVWDGFTHDYGWAVAWLPVLRTEVYLTFLPGLPWYKLLQHGSTLVGGAIVVAWVAVWARRFPPGAWAFAPGQAARSLGVLITLAGVAVAAGLLNGLRAIPRGAAHASGFAVVGAMAGLALAVVGYGALTWARGQARPGGLTA